MGNFVEFALIAVTLATAVIGTIASHSKWTKTAIIVLAVITSAATAYKAIESSEANRVARNIIAQMVYASAPPQYFAHDLVRAFGSILEDGKFVSSQIIDQETHERLLMVSSQEEAADNDFSGVLFLSQRALGPIYYSYAAGKELSSDLERVLENRWTSCPDHQEACTLELAAIGKQSLEVAPYYFDETVAAWEDGSFYLKADNPDLPVIRFDNVFINELYGLPAAERGLRILEAGHQQIIDSL